MFRLLGVVEADVAGKPIKLGWRQERCLLALLLLDEGRPVHSQRLAELVWEGEPPADARAALQVVVARLRGHLNAADAAAHGVRLLTKGESYGLEVPPEQVDLARFKMLVARARSVQHPERAAALLRTALRLWRGPALADVAGPWLRQRIIEPLEEQRLTATEELMEIELAAGRHHERIAELTQLVAEHPLRERLRGQLMLALAREGRRVAALDSYERLRRTLRETFGLEPGAQLRDIHGRILRAEHDVPAPPAATAAGGASLFTGPGAAAPAPNPPPAAAPATTGPAGRSGAGPAAAAVPSPGPAPAPAAAHAFPAGPGLREPPASVPAPATAAPAELPATFAGFVGRDEELARLDALLPCATDLGAPVVVSAIAGTAGVGKTALAVHWAQRVAHRFPDGQLYVNLQGYASFGTPLQPVEALGILLRSLGVREDRVPRDVAEAAALFRSMLAGRRVLLLLDNARSVEQVRPLLPGSPGCLVVVTTRDRMTGLVAHHGARRLTIDMLRPEPARALLRDMLGAERVDAEPEAAAELAEACAFLPLALRISAADLTNHPHRSIARHVARLRAANPLLALSVDGEQAVHTALDVSYRTVPADAQRLFRLLGLVSGTDFTAATAAALADTTLIDAARLLDRLAAAHLVTECAPERFTFHDLLRRYARERAGSDESPEARAAAVRRWLDRSLHTVDRAAQLLYPQMVRLPMPPVPEQGRPPVLFDSSTEALAWLEAEWRNLVAAGRNAVADGYPAMAWLLADALRGFLSQGGHLYGWTAISRSGLSAAETAGDLNGQAAMHIGLAHIGHWLCRYEEAVGQLRRAIELSLAGGWLEGHACAIGNLGIFYDAMGRLGDAQEQYTRAIALAREHGWHLLLAGFLDSLGKHQQVTGRLAAAVESLTESLAETARLAGTARLAETADGGLAEGGQVGAAYTLHSLAGTYHAMGRLPDALRLAERALVLCRDVGNRAHETVVLSLLATVHADLGRVDQALALATTAVQAARHIDDHAGTVHALGALADVRRRLGRHRQAVALYEEVLGMVDPLSLAYQQAAAMIGLAATYRDLGRLDTALDTVRQADKLTEQGGFEILRGLARTTAAEIQLAQGRRAEAQRTARLALKDHQRTGGRLAEARTLGILARAGAEPAAGEYRQAAERIVADLGLGAREGGAATT